MRYALSAVFVTAFATGAFAAGGQSDTPPKETQTTTECAEGQIYDEETQACLDAEKQSFNDDQRYDAVRELAYAGAYDRAARVIASANNPDEARFLTYRGFISRKQGDFDAAMTFYSAALAIDPDNLLARSYMGQGLVSVGDVNGARGQLSQIVQRGGRDSWAYAALKLALGGQPSDY